MNHLPPISPITTPLAKAPQAHTPGPWSLQQVARAWRDYPDWNTYAVRGPANHCIAVIGEVDRATEQDNAANARLIASAPALLEALKECVSTMADTGVSLRARAAIALAEGGVTFIVYTYRGTVERCDGKPGYVWHDGYSETSPQGNALFPWMTRSECIADAKAKGGVAQFYQESQPPSFAI